MITDFISSLLCILKKNNSTIYDEPTYSRTPTEADKNILADAEKLKQTILNNTESIPCTGKAYYVSNSGNDKNDWLSPETAWKTLDKVNSANLNRGDGVYFERGCIWSYDTSFTEGGTFSPGGGALGMSGNTELYSVTDCYFYQHLDAALSHQATAPIQGTGDVEPLRQRNITYARNVVEYTDMPVEIFYNLRGYLDDTTYMMENVLVEDNYFLYTGYGWGSQLYKKSNFSSAYMGALGSQRRKKFQDNKQRILSFHRSAYNNSGKYRIPSRIGR